MGFVDLDILNQYKTYKNNIVEEFYNPVLSESIQYQRSVGFFSSTALTELAPSMLKLAKNKGKISLIVSPHLSDEDIDAINKGYEKRKIIEECLIRNIDDPNNAFEKKNLNLLANLISDGILDIKVAFTPPNKKTGMYHEKVGIMTDIEGNKIAFTGSLNETLNAFYNNYESIVVFKSWGDEKKYVDSMQEDFDELWNNKVENIETIEFPDVAREKLLSYKNESLDYTSLSEYDFVDDKKQEINSKGEPRVPKGFKFHKYQQDAIDEWKRNGYRGIFDMATGTGKTYTGLGAAVELFNNIKKLAIIIVCPYQHLVDQWVEDIEYFNMLPTIGYSASPQKNWKKRLENDIFDYNLGIIDSFCFVTTNATFSSKYVTEKLEKIKENILLIVDEAHNFGAEGLRNKLNDKFNYRLALSATIDRYGDVDGTQILKNYFGKKCIEYNLDRAIKEEKLTPYYYYPVLVYLDDDEIDKYRDLSYLISKEVYEDKNKRIKITEKGKILLLSRSRLVAGARQKLDKLRELMKEYKDSSHILVYCGATKTEDYSADQSEKDDEGERQIIAVSKILGNELGMKVRHFTSQETAEERETIKRQFASVSPYQALVAIKCLDEGVNIPSIKTAFILASTTNPKEYIQRRGRVLRLAPNKPFAVIYDFVTLVRPLDEVDQYSNDFKFEKALAKREYVRICEFGSIAENSSDSDELIKKIESVFKINENSEEDSKDGSEYE
jgi:superfamily II DNA or RNA helicase